MTAKSRLDVIQDLVKKEKRVVVSELSEICGVTEETIRKDLTKLEEQGVVTRVHGGAVLVEQKQYNEVYFIHRQNVHAEEKRRIAELAIPLIQNGNTLFADSSTTVAEMLRSIPEQMDLTLVSNSTNIFLDLVSKNMNIICTGGTFNKKYLSLQGLQCKESIAKYNVDVALLSCKALDMERGVQDSSEGEADIKKLMVEHAKKVILLADHTKFDQTAFVHLMDLEHVTYLVTDQRPEEKWVQYCQDHNIQLIY